MQKTLLYSLLIITNITTAQVKIGYNITTVGISSLLELEDSSKALVITRVANTAAITNPVNGMIVYDLSSNCTKYYQNNAWTPCADNTSVICQYISTNNPNITNTFIVFNQLDTRCGDSHNAYNTTNGEYTAPVSGRYQIDMNFMTAGMAAGSSLVIYAYINGVQQGGALTDSYYTPTTERNRMRLNGFVIKLNSSDKFKLYCETSVSEIIDNSSGNVFNYLSIKRIGDL